MKRPTGILVIAFAAAALSLWSAIQLYYTMSFEILLIKEEGGNLTDLLANFASSSLLVFTIISITFTILVYGMKKLSIAANILLVTAILSPIFLYQNIGTTFFDPAYTDTYYVILSPSAWVMIIALSFSIFYLIWCNSRNLLK